MYQKQIERYSSLEVNVFIFSTAHLLALKYLVLYNGLYVFYSAEETEVLHVKMVCSVYQIGKVEVIYVVSREDVGIQLSDELGPFLDRMKYNITD